MPADEPDAHGLEGEETGAGADEPFYINGGSINMTRSPAFQFYVGDWMQDTRCLSLAAKGAWIDLLSAMWHSQTRGVLSYPIVGYARLIGASVEQTKAAIDELIDMRICDAVTEGNGNVTLKNRRMVREESERNSTRLRVQRFRNAEQKRESNDLVTVPSSSSSSSSNKEPPNPQGGNVPVLLERFSRFWKEYPKKIGKGAAEKTFLKLHPSEDLLFRMLKAVQSAMQSAPWLKDGGQYIPNPATWLNQKRWEDEIGGGNGTGAGPMDPVAEIRKIREAREARERESGSTEASGEAGGSDHF